jgi:GPI mannosyltransferase 3
MSVRRGSQMSERLTTLPRRPAMTSSTGQVAVGPPRSRRHFWVCVTLFALAAFAARFGLALGPASIHRPDEVFQALEPAHRLWSGWGVVSWEWRDGIRSWLFPWFLAGLMTLSGPLGLGPDGYLPLIAATLSLASAGVVVVGIVLGWRHSGLAGAVLCGTLCTFWPDLVYFAPRTLAEVQAGNLLVVAAGLASLAPRAEGRCRAALCLATGALLGLAFCLRFQLAPALLLVALWAGGRKDLRHRWLPLLLGGVVPLIALGMSDALSWGTPFQSVWKNLYVNLVEQRSEAYGISPPLWFVSEVAHLWGVALLPVLIFFCLGAREAPLMAATAAVVVVSHSAIAHKEISFIYAAVPATMIVAGIGTARAALALPRLLRPQSVLALAAVLWLAVAGLTGGAASSLLRPGGTDNPLAVWAAARQRPDLCGLGLYGPDFPWYLTGGYAFLNRPVPIYLLRTPEALAHARPGMNYLVADRQLAGALRDYAAVLCARGYCLMRHDQPCTKEIPGLEINAVLEREGA